MDFPFIGVHIHYEGVKIPLDAVLRFLTCTFIGGTATGMSQIGASWYVFVIMWLYLLTPLLLKGLYWFEKKHEGREIKCYIRLLAVLCAMGILYRAGGSFVVKV